MNKVAIYARYSDFKQSIHSVDDQVRLCRERADAEGWQVTEVLTDRALSGATMFLRPGIQQLLEGVRERRFDAVIAESVDRLSRDQEDIAHIYKRIRHADMRFCTIAEGEISELHIGLKGTMGALYLKDLAQKTHRGLQGRALAGKSAGGVTFGYDVVHSIGSDGRLIRGERKINAAEAAIVIRIFEDYASGKSAKRIAHDLNRDGIPGPRGNEWGHTTINGNRKRGTGILNNELYIGLNVWNRLRYLKNPDTGKRESRQRADEEVVSTPVPELRIVSQDLWERVKAVQGSYDGRAHFWQKQRPKRLLSGLTRCGCCGGGYSKISATHLGCSTARSKGTCENRTTMHAEDLEAKVLGALSDKLMNQELCAAFCEEYAAHMKKLRQDHNAALAGYQAEFERNKRDIDHMIDRMLRDGVDPKLLKDRINGLGARQEELEQLINSAPEIKVLPHPNMAKRYADEVQDLLRSMNDPEHRTESIQIIRSLVEKVVLTPTEDGSLAVDLYGDLAGILQVATFGEIRLHKRETAPEGGSSEDRPTSQAKVVAGTRSNQYPTFRVAA